MTFGLLFQYVVVLLLIIAIVFGGIAALYDARKKAREAKNTKKDDLACVACILKDKCSHDDKKDKEKCDEKFGESKK